MAARILDLTNQTERGTVHLPSGQFQVRSYNDLTVEEFQAFERMYPRLGDLLALETRTDDQVAERKRLSDQICRMGLVATDDVHASLSDIERTAVVDFFLELCSPMLLSIARARAELPAQAESPTAGTPSSPDSPGSTAAPRSRGSRKPRSG